MDDLSASLLIKQKYVLHLYSLKLQLTLQQTVQHLCLAEIALPPTAPPSLPLEAVKKNSGKEVWYFPLV